LPQIGKTSTAKSYSAGENVLPLNSGIFNQGLAVQSSTFRVEKPRPKGFWVLGSPFWVKKHGQVPVKLYLIG
jgi:hypothetical protein